MTDCRTPLSIAFRSRCRQASIWVPTSVLVSFHALGRALSRGSDAPSSVGTRSDWIEILLVAWFTVAVGFRPTGVGLLPSTSHAASGASSRDRLFMSVGAAIADGLTVATAAIATVLIRVDRAWAPPSTTTLFVGGAALIAIAKSVEFSAASERLPRVGALGITLALTVFAAVVAVGETDRWGSAVGSLVFPLSSFVAAAEEPLRFGLVARAYSAGGIYVLALLAALLALVPGRARGKA